VISWLKHRLRSGRSHPVEDAELSDYVDGRVPTARLEFVERHVAGCETCRSQVTELKAVQAMLRSLPAPLPPRSFTLSPEAARSRPPVEHGLARAPVWAPALALSVLVLLLAVDLVDIGGGNGGGSAGLSASQEKSTAAGQREAFDAPGGATAPAPSTAPVASAAQPHVASGAAQDSAATGATPAAARSAAAQATPVAPSPASEAGSEKPGGDSGTSAIHLLEGLAALVFLGSAGYVWWWDRSRRAT
jgi:anti-sigma factor RsiW